MRHPPHRNWPYVGLAALTAAVTVNVAAYVGSQRTPDHYARALKDARAVAGQFFAAMQEHRFDRACELLSLSYLRENRMADRDTCALNLSVGFLARDLEFEIADVQPAGKRIVVHAVANGSPGKVVLARENDAYRVVSVTGA